MSDFNHLGKALRWLRGRRGLRQYQVAEAAGVTKAMLSYYENDRQSPSLTTLDRILKALGVSLGDLEQVLRLVAGEKQEPITPRLGPKGAKGGGGEPGGLDLEIYRFLGLREPLPIEKEETMQEALAVFQKLLRQLHHDSPQAERPSRNPQENGED